MSGTKKNDWKNNEVGALWIRKGKVNDFLAGPIKVGDEQIDIIIFSNKGKEKNPKAPDYIIYLDEKEGVKKKDPKKEEKKEDPFIKTSPNLVEGVSDDPPPF